jgi:hypothetical protein
MTAAMGPLARLSDNELRSLVGQIHAELTHRQRVRTSDFREAVRLIEERERHPEPSILKPVPMAHGGRRL